MSTPIEGLMNETLGNLKHMIDVNTIVGDAITTPDGTTIIPVSKVAFGFGAGGCEFTGKYATEKMEKPLFGGGCGGGVSLKPIAFLAIKNDSIRLIPVGASTSTADRIIDMLPEVFKKFNGFVSDFKNKSNVAGEPDEEIQE